LIELVELYRRGRRIYFELHRDSMRVIAEKK
jgi:hypothetical protein